MLFALKGPVIRKKKKAKKKKQSAAPKKIFFLYKNIGLDKPSF